MSKTPVPSIPSADEYLGAWGIEKRGEASLDFVLEDSRVFGSDGCNRIMGSWGLLEDGSVELKQMASTMMMCQDVDTWMAGAAKVLVVDGDLVVSSEAGAVLGTLQRRASGLEPTD